MKFYSVFSPAHQGRQQLIHATQFGRSPEVVAAEDMTGHNGFTVKALPHEEVREVMRRYGRVE